MEGVKIMTEQIDPKELAVMETKTATLLETINALLVIDADSHREAGRILIGADDHIIFVKGKLDPICSATNKAHKAATAMRNEAVGPAEKVKRIVNTKISDYLMEQARIRREAEAKERQLAEAAAKVERERIEAEAEKDLDAGNFGQAEEKIQQAETVVPEPVFVAKTVEKKVDVGGGSMNELVGLEVILPESVEDIVTACRAIVDGLLPIDSVTFKTAILKSHAKNNRLIGKHYGVTFKETRKASIRRDV